MPPKPLTSMDLSDPMKIHFLGQSLEDTLYLHKSLVPPLMNFKRCPSESGHVDMIYSFTNAVIIHRMAGSHLKIIADTLFAGFQDENSGIPLQRHKLRTTKGRIIN